MRLMYISQGQAARRDCWSADLTLVRDDQGEWQYIKYGENAGRPSKDMLDGSDFIECENPKKDKEIKMIEDVNFVGGEYNVVQVSHLPLTKGHKYNYKIMANLIVAEGNLVVVHNRDGMALARVTAVYPNNFENALEINKAQS